MKTAVLLDDMLFTSKISAAAKQLNAQVVFCTSAASVPSDATRICVDLNATTFDAVAEIKKLKITRGAPIFAYVSHVQVQLKTEAEEAGATEVMPRSAFVQRLAAILSD
jgi:hypothetical protein